MSLSSRAKPPYLMGYDFGTSACKCVLIDTDGHIAGVGLDEWPVLTPQPGWAEQSAEEWWRAMKVTAKIAIKKAGARPEDIEGVGFDGHCGNFLPVDRDGKPLRNEIMYSDARAIKQKEEYEQLLLKEGIDWKKLYYITGCPLSEYWGVPKYFWMKENNPEVWRKTYNLLAPKDYGVFKLTHEFSADHSNASLTLLYNVKECGWSDVLMDIADMSPDMFPPLHWSVEAVGEVTSKAAEELGIKKGITVVAGSDDSLAQLPGTNVLEHMAGILCIGGAAWMGFTCDRPVFGDPAQGVILQPHVDKGMWWNAAVTNTAGASLKWFKENFCQGEVAAESLTGISAYKIIDRQASSSPVGSRNMIFLPYLLGERGPIWDGKARGTFVGITLSSRKEDFARAIMEGVAFSLKHLMDNMPMTDQLKYVRFIGGGGTSTLWGQITSDVLGISGDAPEYPGDAAAIGSALCASVGTKTYPDIYTAAEKTIRFVSHFDPNLDRHERYCKLFDLYKQIYPALKEVMHTLAEMPVE